MMFAIGWDPVYNTEYETNGLQYEITGGKYI